MQNAARTERQPRRTLTVPRVLAIRAICAIWVSQGKPLNIHSPRVPCYMCYMCYISQGKPLNIHSSPGPCYMCYMCYMALYSTYTTDFRAYKEPGDCGGSAAWPSRNVNTSGTCVESLSLEGVSQMVYILPERLLALVRPAFDLVLRRIRSLKRCVQACGCKIMTPRYAPQFGSRLHFKQGQALPKEPPFPFFFLGPLVFFFCFFLSPAKVGSLEMQPGAELQAYLGVIILQPHACTQRFRLRILRRTRSNAGRTSARSLSGRI